MESFSGARCVILRVVVVVDGDFVGGVSGVIQLGGIVADGAGVVIVADVGVADGAWLHAVGL